MTEPDEAATFESATVLYKKRKFARALDVCRELVSRDPASAPAWHLLGASALALGDHAAAVEALEKATLVAPKVSLYAADLGAACLAKQDIGGAVDAFSQAIALDPAAKEPRDALAKLCLRGGDFRAAELHFRHLTTHHPAFDAWHGLARALTALGRVAEAVPFLEKVIKERPDVADAHTDLGVARTREGRLDLAEPHFARAARLDSKNALTHRNLGMVLQARGDLPGAASSLKRAIELGDQAAATYDALAAVLAKQGQLAQALNFAQEAVTRDPKNSSAQNTLGLVLLMTGRMEDSLPAFRRAVEIDPSNRATHTNLIHAESQCGDLEAARRHAQAALSLRPTHGLEVQIATLLPPIYESKQALVDARARLVQNVAALRTRDLVIPDPVAEVGSNAFFLAYHGENDRDIQREIASLFRFLPTEIPLSPQARKTRRIGFISRHLHASHPVARVSAGVITALAKRGLEVVVLHPQTTAPPDWGTRLARAFPLSLQGAREAIARERLDVLVYLDLGMDPFTYFLAFTRLAPVQCLLGGHPSTSGVPAMDYFVSWEACEADDPTDHYTESVVRLKGTGASFVRPKFEDVPGIRSELGLATDRTLYLCPMLLQKVHPDMDEPLAEILRRDPRGDIVFFKAPDRPWHKRLIDRFRKTIPDVVDRIRIIDHLPPNRFFALLKASDVLLDTFHFSAGTTSFFSFAAGTPIVTLPGAFLRGRITAGYYKMMGLESELARDPEDYVARAVRLGTDREQRDLLRRQILERNSILFEDATTIDEMARFLSEVSPPGSARP